MPDPHDRTYTANRLRLHLLEWGEGERVVLLVHGFLEHAHAWDLLAPRLVRQGFHVFALDCRGHGDSAWVGEGGYYHFLDYIADLSFLVPQLAERVALVGHSMGGGAAVLYAGTEPERVSALISIEGLGLPDTDQGLAVARVAAWIEDLGRCERRVPKPVDVERAVAQMCSRFPTLPAAAARHLVMHNSRETNGTRTWKFDPLHQTQAPQPMPLAQRRAFWERVSCPVLYVAGGDSSLRLPPDDLATRLAILRARQAVIPGAGHHPHLEEPEELARVMLGFLG